MNVLFILSALGFLIAACLSVAQAASTFNYGIVVTYNCLLYNREPDCFSNFVPDISDPRNRSSQIHFTISVLSLAFCLYATQLSGFGLFTPIIICGAVFVWGSTGLFFTPEDDGSRYGFIYRFCGSVALIFIFLAFAMVVFVSVQYASLPTYTEEKIISSTPLSSVDQPVAAGGNYLSPDFHTLYHAYYGDDNQIEISATPLDSVHVYLADSPADQRIVTRELATYRLISSAHSETVRDYLDDPAYEYDIYLTDEDFRNYLRSGAAETEQ